MLKKKRREGGIMIEHKKDEIAIKQFASHAYSNYQVIVHTPMSDLVTQKPTRYNGKEKCQGVGYWYGHRQL